MDHDHIEDAATSFLLPSRRAALERCLDGLRHGPVLITGEPGIGKTWLAERIAEAAATPAFWVRVDVEPLFLADDFTRALGQALGVRAGTAIEVAECLLERSQDGRRWGLIVDEAHLASTSVLEVVRLLTNRLGRPDGFDAIVLVGQSALSRRLATRPLAALDARIAAAVRLWPLDRDEAADFLEAIAITLPTDRLDVIHRDALGNPARLVRALPAAAIPRLPVDNARPGKSKSAPTAPVLAGLVESKPPIWVAENEIEVGWQAEPAAEPIEPRPTADGPEPEPVEDHYTALQAWMEWSRNTKTLATSPNESGTPAAGSALAENAEPDEADHQTGPAKPSEGKAHVWMEPSQTFAPYGQLFSRSEQARDTEP